MLGTKGAIIAQLQNRSGCQILINQDFPPGAPREVTFIGTPTQVHAAQQLVQIVMMNGPLAIQMLDGPILSAEIPCPHKAVGRIIGSQGHTIKDIERRCGVMIKIDENFPEGVDRVISITGNGQAVDRAKDMLEYVMKNGSLGPLNHEDVGPPIPLLTPHHTQLVECPKSSIGRIIGKGGGTINQIQAKSQTKIHIEQNVPVGKPCRIHVTGEISAIQQAIKYLREVAGGPPKPSSHAQSSLPAISLLGDCESSLRPTQSPTDVPSLPPHWTEHVTDDGHVYWYNSLTSISEVGSLSFFII